MSKPEWAQQVEEAYRLVQRGGDLLMEACNKLRCSQKDSNGYQCTADRHVVHDHRYAVEDLPNGEEP